MTTLWRQVDRVMNMPRWSLFRALLCVLCASVVQAISPESAEAQAYPRVIIQTDFGNIEAEIDTVHAPLTAANFLR